MEITSSAFTALFLGMAWTIVRTVEFFISKKKNNKWGAEQEKKLSEIHKFVTSDIKEYEKKLLSIQEKIQGKVQEIYYELSILKGDFIDVKVSQTSLIEKVFDLISYQKIVAERIGDLINKLNSLSK